MTAQVLFAAFAVVLSVGYMLALGLPVLHGRDAPPDDERAAALKDRLDAIERDRAAGLIGEEAAADAVIDAKRAALAADVAVGARPSKTLRFVAVALLALSPPIAAGLYFLVGAPSLLDPPTIAASPAPALDAGAIAAMSDEDRQAMIESMVAGLEARLAQQPDDAEGWRMLARSQMVLQRPADSAASYRKLLTIETGGTEDWRNFAMALAMSAPEGRFPSDDEFLRALDEIEAQTPGDPMVLFYRGGAARERGDVARAVELWTMLLSGVPEDAPARQTLVSLIEQAKSGAPSP